MTPTLSSTSCAQPVTVSWSANPTLRHERSPEEREHVLTPLVERRRLHRVTVEQSIEEGRIGEIGEQSAVSGDHQLPRIVVGELTGFHRCGEITSGSIKERTQHPR